MPATVSHVLSMTTPDNALYENKPSDWNKTHALTLNATGTEISNAFSNANGISFGISAGAITGSYTVPSTAGLLSNIRVSGGTTSNLLSAITFGDANGISFGLNASTMTASHNGLTSQSNQAFSAAGGSSAFQTLIFTNSNNVSFTNTNGSVAASIATSLSNIRISAGTTSNLLSDVTFANANGLSFGLNASTITGSYSRNVASNAIQAVGSASGSGTNTSRFAADDHVHPGVFSIGVSTAGNTVGDTRVDVGRFVFQGGNNVTLSQITAANALNTIIISGGAAGGADGVNALVVNGGASTASTTLALSNSNNVSFGLNAGTITATASFAQTNQTVGLYGSSQTTGSASSGTLDARSLSIIGAGIISIGLHSTSAGGTTTGLLISATQSNQAWSGSNASSTFQTLVFNNANGVSWSNNAGSVQASYTRNVASNAIQAVGSASGSGTNTSRFAADDHVHPGVFSMGVSTAGNTIGDTRVDVGRFVLQGGNNITLSQITAANALNTIIVSGGAGGAGETRASVYAVSNTTQSTSGTIPLSLLSFQGNGIISAGVSNGSVVLSATQSNQAVSNSAGSFTFQTLNFSNANNVTFGTSAGGIITASVAAPGAAAENNWVNLLGANTAGNTTASGSTLGYSGINLTLSGTNGSVVNISAPATSSLVGSQGISLSTNGSTISILGDGFTAPGYHPYDDFVMVLGQLGQGTLQVDPQVFPNVAFDRLGFFVQNTNSSNSSGSHSLSFRVGLYTRNNATLSLYTSWMVSTAVTHSGTAGSYSWYSGQRLLALTVPATTIPASRYWIAVLSNTTSGGANGTYSNYMVSNLNSQFTGLFGVGSNATYQPKLGQGYYTATTNAIPNSIGFNQINGTNSAARRMLIVGFHSSTV